MEKDDEVSGLGNSYTADFWQYDSRLGRRWNTDPVIKFHESPYAAFANSPIWLIDPSGADTSHSSVKSADLVNSLLNPESENYDEDFAGKVNELFQSDDNFQFNIISGKGGNVAFDGESVIINFGLDDMAPNIGWEAALYEEIEHAVQALHGELGFGLTDDGIVLTYGLDQTDEINGFLFGSTAPNVYNSGRIKKLNKAIAAKDITKIVAITISRSPSDYLMLSPSPTTAEADAFEQGVVNTNGKRYYIRPFTVRTTPIQKVLQK